VLIFGAATASCTGSTTQQPLDQAERAERDQRRDVVAELEAKLPDLLRQVAQKKANQLTIDAILAAPEQHLDGIELQQVGYLRKLYEANDHTPVWVQVDGTSAQFHPGTQALLGALRKGASAHGLWRDELHLDRLEVVELGSGQVDVGQPFEGVTLDERDRQAILAWLAEQDTSYSPSDEDLRALTTELVSEGRPLDRLHSPVKRQVARLSSIAEVSGRADVLFSDALVQYAVRVRYENPAWQRGESWPERLQEPSEDDGQTSEQTTKKKLSGEQLVQARRDYLVMQAFRPVFDDASKANALLADLPPHFEPYRRLTEAFERYAKIVDDGGWPLIPDEAEGLKRGATSEHITTVKERLRIEGYFDGDNSKKFDNALRRAILSYQTTHQLWENGWLTPQTMSSLNSTATDRWNQIRLTLERWRNSRVGPDTHYVHVNIPDFHASGWKDNERDLYFKVVVGSTTQKENDDGEKYYRHATPRFSDELEYLVFNPFWNVPKSIREKELEPKFEENPEEFEEKGYEYHTDDNGHRFLRQKPGPQNALGRVKFIFPNDYNVYLHDTPQKHLFKHPFRAYSHGCVRVEEPMKFAHYLLDLDGRWKDEKREEKLDEWYAKDGPTWVKLRQSLPIHIEYYVVRVDDTGHTNFLADLYRLDRPRLQEIAKRVEAQKNDKPSEPQPDPSQTARSENP
jgi:murein L,D-transpeptidase YcbB/YkuD